MGKKYTVLVTRITWDTDNNGFETSYPDCIAVKTRNKVLVDLVAEKLFTKQLKFATGCDEFVGISPRYPNITEAQEYEQRMMREQTYFTVLPKILKRVFLSNEEQDVYYSLTVLAYELELSKGDSDNKKKLNRLETERFNNTDSIAQYREPLLYAREQDDTDSNPKFDVKDILYCSMDYQSLSYDQRYDSLITEHPLVITKSYDTLVKLSVQHAHLHGQKLTQIYEVDSLGEIYSSYGELEIGKPYNNNIARWLNDDGVSLTIYAIRIPVIEVRKKLDKKV